MILMIVMFLVVCAILGFVAFVRQARNSTAKSNAMRIGWLERRVRRLEEQLASVGPGDAREPQKKEEAEEIPLRESERQSAPGIPSGQKTPVPPPAGAGSGGTHREERPVETYRAQRPEKSLWQGIEKAVGEKWIAWVGVMVIFLALAFFIKHAIDMGWLGPTARCTLGVIAGIIMAGAGDRCLRRDMRGLGQGLVGGGLAALYLSLFSAFYFYDLMPPEFAFGFMVAVTAGGMLLALLHDALPIAFIAVLGGLLTPVLCRTGVDQRDLLFSYITVLNMGVLGIALFRRWRALDMLAFAGAWLLFGGWYARFYSEAMLTPTVSWLLVFFVVFLLLPFGYHLRTGLAVPLERFLLGMINAAVAFGFAFDILHPEHHYLLGFIALGMAASYSLLGTGLGRRDGKGRDMHGFLALAMIFLTVAVPLHMGLHGTLIVWVAQSVALLYLGYRFGYLPVRLGAFAVFCVALIRFFTVHWPLHEMDFVLFWNTSFATALCVPIGGAVFAWLHRRRNPGAKWDCAAQRMVEIGSCLLAILILQSELGLWLIQRGLVADEFRGEYFARFTCVVIWTLGGLCMLAGGIRWRSPAMRLSAVLPLAMGLILLFIMYLEQLPEQVLLINLRFAGALTAVSAAFLWAYSLRRWVPEWDGKLGGFIGWMALFVLWFCLSMESWHFFLEFVQPADRARWVALMAVSITWGVYATALLVAGFLRDRRSLRLVALGLFAVTGGKLVFVDMAGVRDIYRIISFLAIGLLMVGASYLYHKTEKKVCEKENG